MAISSQFEGSFCLSIKLKNFLQNSYFWENWSFPCLQIPYWCLWWGYFSIFVALNFSEMVYHGLNDIILVFIFLIIWMNSDHVICSISSSSLSPLTYFLSNFARLASSWSKMRNTDWLCNLNRVKTWFKFWNLKTSKMVSESTKELKLASLSHFLDFGVNPYSE